MMNVSDLQVASEALKLPSRCAGLTCDSNEVELWHLLRSLLEFCDAQHPRIDFDAVLSDVRADFNA